MFGCRGVCLTTGMYNWNGNTFNYWYWFNNEEVKGWTELVGSEMGGFKISTTLSDCWFVLLLDIKGRVDKIDFYSDKEAAIKAATKYMEGI